MSTLCALLIAGCSLGDRDTLEVAESIPLRGSAASALYVDPGGGVWVGSAGELVRLASGGGGEEIRYPVGGSGVLELVGAVAGSVYFRTADSLLRVDMAGGTLIETPMPGSDAAAIDPKGHFLLRAESGGTVVAHEADSLRAVWGWGAVGGATRAIAISPQGDRVYQAVDAPEAGGSAGLLVRDLLTGRILLRLEVPEPIRQMAAGADGNLVTAGWEEDGGGAVTRLFWEEGELRRGWRRTFSELGAEVPLRLIASPAGDAIAVLSLNEEAGLHLLDAESGRTMERLRGFARGVAFDAAGGIYLLTPEAVVRVE